ncbi:MAG TPA: gamma subclass chorismate mutase AroQ [Steroidobacteraceae bacterium]|jgi:chorismate mutase-like protein|nr:gamma subclass chorismate mutase AroQ [Steroidobacteraceae bacterium]
MIAHLPLLRKAIPAIRLGRLLVLLLALPGVLAAAGTDRLQAIRDAGVLRVGTTGDYKPFSYRDPSSGWLLGADIAMARDLATDIGVRLELVPTRWSTLLDDVRADRYDMAMGGISVTRERAAAASFSRPYLIDGKTPITRCEDGARFQTIRQINQAGVRVIVNPGGTNERFARRHFGRAGLRVHADNLTIFDELVAGRADVMVTDATEARLQQRLRPELCAQHPGKPFDSAPKAYLLPRDAAFKAFVDDWLKRRLAPDGALPAVSQWLAHPWPRGGAEPGDARAQLVQLVDARLAVMPDVARYKWNAKAAIEDLPREQEVLVTLGREAAALGLPPDTTERFLRAQIEASKQMQRELFARWQAQGLGRFAQVPDLARDIRPQLDALTSRLLRALAIYEQGRGASPGIVQRGDLGVLTSDGVSPASVEIAVAPLYAPPPALGR